MEHTAKNKNKILEITLHLLFWLLYYFYPLLVFAGQKGYIFDYKASLVEISFIMASVYAFSYLYFKKENLTVAVLSVVGIVLCAILVSCVFYTRCDCNPYYCYFNRITVFFFINMFFIGINALKKSFIANEKLSLVEREKTEYELEILKSQINPHFLFNSLNMIYSSSLTKEEDVSDKILMLSNNLHYVLHEASKKEVALAQEFDFIKDYISLFEMRFKNKLDLKLDCQSDNSSQMIPPLLLIPFIENALKYTSLISEKKLSLPIKIHLEKGILHFSIQNPFLPQKTTDANKRSGIGIANVKKRLSILYPGRHELHIKSENNIFYAALKIRL
ncbi:MAG TPA: histidine kinase [Flavobacterium sp.]|nr:histidine kinase [Flavobacterium sp.]